MALDSNGDRIESYEVMNYVLEGDAMSSVAVGMYDGTLQQYRAYELSLVRGVASVTQKYLHAGTSRQ